MVRRYVNGQLFDILPGGTSIPIISDAPPRKLPIWILSTELTIQTVIEEFLAAFLLPNVQLPGINIPTNVPPPIVPEGAGIPEPEPMQLPVSEQPPSVQLPPEQPPNTGNPIFTRFGIPPDDLIEAIQEFWPEDQWKNAAEISFLESTWRNNAINDTVSIHGACGTRYFIDSLSIWAQTELSIGYFQINICAHGGSIAMWENARNNARKGAELYHSAGNKYTPWIISAANLGLPR